MKIDASYKIKGYYPTIGIECHVQLKTKSKLFSTDSNEARGAAPNTQVGHVCFGLPGALPVLNEAAVYLACRAAIALNTTAQHFSKFDRKHYFYPDLPKGYQISQFDEPIILGGFVTIMDVNGSEKRINITRAHLEEDAGKSTHPSGENYSLVDLNRAGTPLLEIVSEPELHSAFEGKAYAKELWLAMKCADVSDVDLYHGNMRFDVNVSVSKDPEVFGTRTETKNLNSFRSVERAITYEINRQIAALEAGEEIVQETRGWLDDEQKTVSQRSKENAHDYRYFPDPDIPPVVLTPQYLEEVKAGMVVLPNEWRAKLRAKQISTELTEQLLEVGVQHDTAILELVASADSATAKVFGNWAVNSETPLYAAETITPEVARLIAANRQEVYQAVYELVSKKLLSSGNAKTLLTTLLQSDTLPENIEAYADSCGLLQVSDDGELVALVSKVLAENPKAVEDIRSGEGKVIGFLVGQTMKRSAGKANPEAVQRIIKEQLGE